ncbi:MAG: peptidyl-alpha-hydroxyglycine alpha-amidating lyase family protein [Pseudohongiellaceae bacterium]|nr:peptidyl-alpha-hydroxyglycine alpha-amidating lyase family protein [Pseudohongiellaceae bacterium]
MSTTRILLTSALASATVILAACNEAADAPMESAMPAAVTEASSMPAAQAEPMTPGNIITGAGIPNPNPNVTIAWGELPEGREWGSTAGVDIDPTDGNIVAYERCGAGNFGAGVPVNCDTNPVDPIFKFDHEGNILKNFGSGIFMTPHGIHADTEGNIWVTDFAANEEGTKGHQVHKFSPDGELLMSLGVAGQAGNDSEHFNQPNDVIVGPNGNIYVADGHSGQGMLNEREMEEGRAAGLTGRIMKFAPDGTFIKQWGQIGVRHGEFRTPHALEFDSEGRLWVADRGNHRIEIFDQEGNYLESRYSFSRISGLFITEDDMVYAIDSESSPTSHPNWRNGVRIGHIHEDVVTGFIPPFERESRLEQGTAGEGVAVDAMGNVYAAEGPNSLSQAGGAFTKYSK